VRVLDMAYFRKIITRHDTGLGEAYMDEDYEVGQNFSHPFLGRHAARAMRSPLCCLMHRHTVCLFPAISSPTLEAACPSRISMPVVKVPMPKEWWVNSEGG
jgi:hypothetical protein